MIAYFYNYCHNFGMLLGSIENSSLLYHLCNSVFDSLTDLNSFIVVIDNISLLMEYFHRCKDRSILNHFIHFYQSFLFQLPFYLFVNFI